MLQVEERRLIIEGSRFETYESHLAAVRQVVQTVRERLNEPLSLEDMADIACLSPYYFCRVFHNVMGLPPGEFFSAMRLDAAKQLLLTTPLSITDICFEVGYSGLGSFSTRFTQLVGLSPRHLRHVARYAEVPSLAELHVRPKLPTSIAGTGSLRGQIRAEKPFSGLIFIGLFPKPLPQGRTVRCTVLPAPGPFQIDHIPPGRYFALTAAFPSSDNPCAFLLPNDTQLVGMHERPLFISPNAVHEPIEIMLRPRRETDPPVVMALPFV